MGITLGGLDIRMAHKFLQHADIDPVLQHDGGETMPQGIAGDMFLDYLRQGFSTHTVTGGATIVQQADDTVIPGIRVIWN